jgi:hypothetical protein
MALKRILLILPILALGGCATWDALTNDISQGYQSVANYVEKKLDPIIEKKKTLPVYDGACPNVSTRADLAHLVDFNANGKAEPSNVTSEVTIKNVDNVCRVEGDSIAMQIDFVLEGKLGPKGRMKANDQPNFAYPYFVAVVDGHGQVIYKEIFAATIAYDRDEKRKSIKETIFQSMPFPDTGSGESYNVIIGFQLDDEQLAYNQKFAASASPSRNSNQRN